MLGMFTDCLVFVLYKMHSFLPSIITSFLGADACVKLQCYEEAISWCSRGLDVSC